MLYIRADANKVIATGHIMRCCSIAEAVERQGEKVTFLTADEYGQELVLEKGFSCLNIDSRWDDLETEIGTMTELIQQNSIQKLLIDTYYVTEKYLHVLSRKTQVTYIDDLHEMRYPCQRLLNYSIYSNDVPYYTEYKNTQLLLGCKYAPLLNVFCNIPSKEINQKIERILVLTGGTDSYHFVLRFLNYFKDKKELASIKFEIICGKYNQDISQIKKLVEGDENFSVHQNINNIKMHMQQADVAISAGGSTLYELCACGTPTVCYILADNQRNNVRGFQKAGIMYNCGDIRDGEECFAAIEQQICKWMKNPKERAAISRKMQQLVDGKGAYRVAKVLVDEEISEAYR